MFDTLIERGQIVIHPTEVERTAALAEVGAAGDLVIADTREQVADLNATIRDHHRHYEDDHCVVITTAAGERIGLGDRVATRRNDPDLQVANRQTWTVTGIGDDGSLVLHDHDTAVARPGSGGSGRVRDPVRRARLRHHRPRRPGRDRRLRARR